MKIEKTTIATVLTCIISIAAFIATFVFGNESIAAESNSEYVEFPFDKLSEFPEEPDWKNDPEAWRILEESEDTTLKFNNLIEEDLKRSGLEHFSYVNHSGDILLEIKSNTEIFGTVFRGKEGNLIIIDTEMWSNGMLITVKRSEYYKQTKRMGILGIEKVCTSSEPINNRGHYFVKGKELFYYIRCNDEFQIKEISNFDDIISGSASDKQGNIYPIIKKDGEMYSYVIEGAVDEKYDHYVKDEIQIREIKLSELDGEPLIEEDLFGDKHLNVTINGGYKISLHYAREDADLNDAMSFSECFDLLIKKKAIYSSYIGKTSTYYLY